MAEFITGFVLGALVLDFAWAWKFGIPQLFWTRITRVFNRVFRK